MTYRKKIMNLLTDLKAAGIVSNETKRAEDWLRVGTKYSNEDFDVFQCIEREHSRKLMLGVAIELYARH